MHPARDDVLGPLFYNATAMGVFGNTPRVIGSLSAMNQGFDTIAAEPVTDRVASLSQQ